MPAPFTVEQAWIGYYSLVVPKSASGDQIRECRRAFYAGAEALYSALMGGLSPGTTTDDADMQLIEDLHAELIDFARSVKEGKA